MVFNCVTLNSPTGGSGEMLHQRKRIGGEEENDFILSPLPCSAEREPGYISSSSMTEGALYERGGADGPLLGVAIEERKRKQPCPSDFAPWLYGLCFI